MPLLVTIHVPSLDAAGTPAKQEFEFGAFGDEAPLASALGYGTIVKSLQPGLSSRRISVDPLRTALEKPAVKSRLNAIAQRWDGDQIDDLIAACAMAALPGARATVAFV